MRNRQATNLGGWALVFLLAALPGPARAADVRLGDILPGGGTIHKNIVSMREARYTGVVQQNTDFSCGAAAVATILKYAYGKNVTEHDVVEGMFRVSDPQVARERGFSLLDIKHYVQTLDMRGRGYKMSMDDLARIRVPTVVLLDIKGYKHFVVLKKIKDGRVYLGDPALGNKVMPTKDFAAGWNGIVFAIIGRGFDRHTALLTPPEPLTVRRSGMQTPLTDAELLDFGFTHADLF